MGDEQFAFTKQDNLKLKLYKLLLKKYAHLINSAEKKTIGEIKSLVNPEDLTIQALLSEFKPDDFEFQRDFIPTAKKLFDFLISEITYVKAELDINYWLTPKEIISNKLGDDEDLAVFLCSILTALGDENAAVLICELDDLSTHAAVFTEFKDKSYLLDPCQNHDFDAFSGDRKQILQAYHFNNAAIKRFIYQFNSKEYKQFL